MITTVEKLQNLIVGQKIKSIKIDQGIYTTWIESIELEDGALLELSVDWRNDLVELEIIRSKS